ncbi:MAG: hypothetical protein CM15mP46_1350 [Alphaproteobacteria bacterium]|nr:MAG: hypothetical protein CM15mP46_1350 [Alphaproteobacteria bacterium]
MYSMANNREASGLLSVDAALDRILASLSRTKTTRVRLTDALGQTLAEDIKATLTLPPHDVSAMDGYAVRADDVVHCPANLIRVGESAAGHPWTGHVECGQAVRIFTGGFVPDGADTIIIQENVDTLSETNHSVITVREGAVKGRFISGQPDSTSQLVRLLLPKATCYLPALLVWRSLLGRQARLYLKSLVSVFYRLVMNLCPPARVPAPARSSVRMRHFYQPL